MTGSVNLKLLWQRDLATNRTHDKWLDILADCGKYVREARRNFTKSNILHRYHHTRVKDNTCWKCKTRVGTFCCIACGVHISSSILGWSCVFSEWMVWFYYSADSFYMYVGEQVSITECVKKKDTLCCHGGSDHCPRSELLLCAMLMTC